MSIVFDYNCKPCDRQFAIAFPKPQDGVVNSLDEAIRLKPVALFNLQGQNRIDLDLEDRFNPFQRYTTLPHEDHVLVYTNGARAAVGLIKENHPDLPLKNPDYYDAYFCYRGKPLSPDNTSAGCSQ